MSNKRDNVKGRLNFDDTDTDMCLEAAPTTAYLASSSPSGSEPEIDLSDIDFSILAEDFSFSELLVDFDIGFEGSTHKTPIETVSWYVLCFVVSFSVNGYYLLLFAHYPFLNHTGRLRNQGMGDL